MSSLSIQPLSGHRGADYTESPGVGDGGREFGRTRGSHAGQYDRDLDAELLTNF